MHIKYIKKYVKPIIKIKKIASLFYRGKIFNSRGGEFHLFIEPVYASGCVGSCSEP